MKFLKIKAGALQVTLFIIVVVSLILMAFFLLVHNQKRFMTQSQFIQETTKLANLGIIYAKHNSIGNKNDTLSIHLKAENYKSLKIYRDFWGVFEKVTSVSKIKNKHFQKTALIGSKQIEPKRLALYVEDNNKPLVLVGNTKIQGDAYIPQQGVKSGTIAGQSFYGSQLINGLQRVSNKLPEVDPQITINLRKLEDVYRKANENQFLSIEYGKQYSNSFSKPLQIIYSNSVLDLRDIKLIGHILIQSKSKIIVQSSVQLTDVILLAPKIEIQDEVKGNFQAIASKNIDVGKSIRLHYPSALIVNEKPEVQAEKIDNTQTKEENTISIDGNSMIKGLVMYLGQNKPNNYKPQIEVSKKATIYGELYCNQNIELKGTIYGTVYTNNFIANEFGSVYQNHIYNATINIVELPEQYVGLSFANSKKEVIKWLY